MTLVATSDRPARLTTIHKGSGISVPGHQIYGGTNRENLKGWYWGRELGSGEMNDVWTEMTSEGWPEAIPIPDCTAEMVARALVQTWIFQFGVPSTVTMDCGRQFESHLWKAFNQLLGTKHIHTTSYQPIANGLVQSVKVCSQCLHTP